MAKKGSCGKKPRVGKKGDMKPSRNKKMKKKTKRYGLASIERY